MVPDHGFARVGTMQVQAIMPPLNAAIGDLRSEALSPGVGGCQYGVRGSCAVGGASRDLFCSWVAQDGDGQWPQGRTQERARKNCAYPCPLKSAPQKGVAVG